MGNRSILLNQSASVGCQKISIDIYDYGRYIAYVHALLQVVPLLRHLREGIIVDLGCAQGRFSDAFKRFLPNATFVGVDLDQQSLRSGNLRHKLFADARKPPFRNACIDLALCLELIEHMSAADALKMLKRIKQILKPDGFLLLSTPNRNSPTYKFESIIHGLLGQEYRGGNSSHVMIYSHDEIVELLRVSGFEVFVFRGYWVLPIGSKAILFHWLRKLLTVAMRRRNPILALAPWLGFIQIYLCADPKCECLNIKGTTDPCARMQTDTDKRFNQCEYCF